MGTTTAPYSIPYPEPTDPVRDGAANMRAIAERLGTMLGKQWAGGGIGIRWGSTVTALGANGEATISISPPFDGANIAPSMGCIVVAMNGDALNSGLIVGAHQPQQGLNYWTVLCKAPGGALPGSGPWRINWIALGGIAI